MTSVADRRNRRERQTVGPWLAGFLGLVLAVTVVLILTQAYFGAVITHGAEHMKF